MPWFAQSVQTSDRIATHSLNTTGAPSLPLLSKACGRAADRNILALVLAEAGTERDPNFSPWQLLLLAAGAHGQGGVKKAEFIQKRRHNLQRYDQLSAKFQWCPPAHASGHVHVSSLPME